MEYDLADDYYGGEQYPSHNAISESEYEARRASIFNPDNTAPMNNAVRGAMPPPSNAWQGQQGAGLYPTMNMLVPQGQQGQSITPLGAAHINMPGLQGQQGQPPATVPHWGEQNIPPAATAPQVQAAQQGGAQIAVQPGGNTWVGGTPTVPGRVTCEWTKIGKVIKLSRSLIFKWAHI